MGPLVRGAGPSATGLVAGTGALVGGIAGLALAGPIGALVGGASGGVALPAMIFRQGRSWSIFLNRTRIDYQSEVGDPIANSVVGAVVGWISRNFPDAPVRILKAGENVPPGATGAGQMLRLLERPNPWYSGVLQWQATVVDFVARGNAYWIKERAASDRVVGLWWVPERMMEPKWPTDRGDVFVGWYEYTVDGTTYILDPRDVVHFRNGIDPLNVRKGLSRLASLFREIFTDDEASNFTASLLRNLGVPGVVIAPANTTGPNQKIDAKTVKETFQETFGGDRRGEPMVMTGATDVKVLSFNPQQMELRELRRLPEERISAVTGVPAGVAGLGAGLDRNTFSNYGEANRAAYTQGVIPLHRLIGAELEVQLLPEFETIGEGVEWDVLFDSSVVAAMADALDAIWKRNESAATKGLITRKQFKIAVGQKPADDGTDDVYVIPNNFLVLDEASGGNTPAASTPPQIGPGRRPPPQLSPGAFEANAESVRCLTCGRLLAESATRPYRITCSRCKTIAVGSEQFDRQLEALTGDSSSG